MTRGSLLVLLHVAWGCARPYAPPRPHEPHAVVKIRRSYDRTAGTQLSERVYIDGNYVLRETVASQIAHAPRTGSVLAHPVPSTFSVHSNFFHHEMRTVSESYEERNTVYRTQSYDCSTGFGSDKRYRTCTRRVPETQYRTRYRLVTKQEEVSDGTCERQFRFAPQADRVYLLQYTYQAEGACEISCYEQVAGPGGTFMNRPCPTAPDDGN